MIIGIASFKGGVCKTTTAVHLSKFLHDAAPGSTALLDGDTTRSCTNWSKLGADHARPFPFPVAPVEAAAKFSREYEHLVIDTGQYPNEADLLALAQYCDVMILPSVPAYADADALAQTIRALRAIQTPSGRPVNFRVLLTRVAPDHAKQVADLREMLGRGRVPMFATEIPRLKAFEKAWAEGLLVGEVDDDRADRAWAAYQAVGKELLDGAR